jgi:uncharacterized protein (TIGR00251 family)
VAEAGAKAETNAGSDGFEDFARTGDGGVYVRLRISPGAKSTGIKGLYGEEALRLSVAAPPTQGRANAEIERYLTRILGVSRSGVLVGKGAHSRDKVVLVRGLTVDEFYTRLSELL